MTKLAKDDDAKTVFLKSQRNESQKINEMKMKEIHKIQEIANKSGSEATKSAKGDDAKTVSFKSQRNESQKMNEMNTSEINKMEDTAIKAELLSIANKKSFTPRVQLQIMDSWDTVMDECLGLESFLVKFTSPTDAPITLGLSPSSTNTREHLPQYKTQQSLIPQLKSIKEENFSCLWPLLVSRRPPASRYFGPSQKI